MKTAVNMAFIELIFSIQHCFFIAFIIKYELDVNNIIIKEFEQLQKMWIQTLVASTMLQKK